MDLNKLREVGVIHSAPNVVSDELYGAELCSKNKTSLRVSLKSRVSTFGCGRQCVRSEHVGLSKRMLLKGLGNWDKKVHLGQLIVC